MIKFYTFLTAILLTTSVCLPCQVKAQSPEKMTYQAVIRDASNNLVASQQIGIQISILQGTADGTPVYIETQTPTTNANGLVSIEIGTGTTTDDFSAIDWSNGTYFIKTETDPTGGTDYTITGTSQLLSVPYALHAKTAETATESDPLFTSWDKTTGITVTESQISDLGTYIETETDPQFAAWDKSTGITITESQISDLEHFTTADETDPTFTSSQAANIDADDITNLGNLSGTNTGDQDISGITTNATAITSLQGEQTTQDAAIALNTEKVSITTAQSDAITANTGKDTTGIYHDNRAALDAISGTNTGDQTLSGLGGVASNTAITGATKTKVTYDAKGLVTAGTDATTADIAASTDKNYVTDAQLAVIGNTSNTNTGDQSLSNVLAQNNDGGATQIKNIADPTADQDAATKAYVDKLLSIIQTLQNGLTDYDGNHYDAIIIGYQIWMTENLKTTHYANGDAIPDGTGAGDISGETEPKYWFAYDNDLNNVTTYGRLYTWYTVTDSRNVCPDGWHVPTYAEWTTLTDYLGGSIVAGGKMKETGTTHWDTPNTGATNETGFTALPGGNRFDSGSFGNIGSYVFWWSTSESEYDAANASYRFIDYSGSDFYGSSNDKKRGYSVRCLRD